MNRGESQQRGSDESREGIPRLPDPRFRVGDPVILGQGRGTGPRGVIEDVGLLALEPAYGFPGGTTR